MAQKDKIKELVGRGLDSYHTKSLQQIDRIEKKNKEQNHKISILSNELDNDYLTKTEEGSVISLEHSKEGMVYLDELQGNTMVNYCTDGSKEMTLNGDIDVEGTFVTTTEGVDNGKVDVLCEGNTLVNEIKGFSGCQTTSWDASNKDYVVNVEGEKIAGGVLWSFPKAKPNTTYTFIIEILETNALTRVDLDTHESYPNISTKEIPRTVGIHKIVFKTRGDFSTVSSEPKFKIKTYSEDASNVLKISKKAIILEGDYAEKEIPPYFQGMKSVGQDDENGHKIEILSQNKNLFDKNSDINFISNTGNNFNRYKQVESDYIRFKYGGYGIGVYFTSNINKLSKGTYTLSCECYCGSENSSKDISIGYRINNSNKPTSIYKLNSYNTWEKIIHTFTISEETDIEGLIIQSSGSSQNYTDIDFRIKNIQLERNAQSTEYIPYALNKKEILLNEPLRGLPSGIKDRFVKIGGKPYIERNCGCKDLIVVSGSRWEDNAVADGMIGFYDILSMGNNYNGSGSVVEIAENIVCDKLPSIGRKDLERTTYDAIIRGNTYIGITVKADKLETQDFEGFKKYINSLNAKFIYNLATPIYEPLEIDPTINTYNDITHISNNSTIPCNIIVKNTGYNAIIKPSTLYTVALDTNKSGTIGMNLGGAKVTTTNNVATITTPATLTDDSLRLYGKGIKGSKVRLLEGDKTNWIPSHFEGIKSSFEDKVQEDGTYKMEILSHTKKLQNQLLDPNLKTHPFPRTNIQENWNVFQWNIGDYYICTKNVIDGDKFKNGDKIYVKFDVIKLSDAHYTSTTWCARTGGYNTTIFSGEFYNSLPINQQKTLKTIITHNPPDSDPRTFKIDFGDYRRDIECNFKIKDITVVNLTRLYGKGNEPTVEWCDENIPYYNTNDMHYVDMNKIQFSSIEPLRGVGDVKDRFVFKDGKLMIERFYKQIIFDGSENWIYKEDDIDGYIYNCDIPDLKSYGTNSIKQGLMDKFGMRGHTNFCAFFGYVGGKNINIKLPYAMTSPNKESIKQWISENNIKLVYELENPVYEEIPFELQKIILEGYENGTLFIDTNIPPTSTVTYAGETPIVKATRLNKTEVLNNTNDINDNIIPYLMDMDYRVVCLQLEGGIENVSMARLFGGTYEMLQRDILSNRYSKEEYKYRLDAYLDANKITEEEYNKLGDMLNE